MQKSKVATIGIVILMFLYGCFTYSNFAKQNNFVYLYIINPIFWTGLALFLRFNLGKLFEKKKNKKQIIEYCLIGVLVYVITYMISGLFITFGNNPYSTTIIGIITNMWILAVSIVAREYIRYKLIQNVYEKDKIKIAIAISIVYIFIDFNIVRFFSRNNRNNIYSKTNSTKSNAINRKKCTIFLYFIKFRLYTRNCL